MPDIVSLASDLKNEPESIESKVVALTLVRDAPDPLNPPVAVTEPLKVALPELFIVNLLVEFVTSWILKSPLPFFIK